MFLSLGESGEIENPGDKGDRGADGVLYHKLDRDDDDRMDRFVFRGVRIALGDTFGSQNYF